MSSENVLHSLEAIRNLEKFFKYQTEHINKLANRIVNELSNEKIADGIRILDIGVGYGALLLPLCKTLHDISPDIKINRVDAFDNSDGMLSLLKQKLDSVTHPDIFRITSGNASQGLPIQFCGHNSEDKYDIIIITFVLQYIDNWKELLKRVKCCLAPGGLLIQAEFMGQICRVDGWITEYPKDHYDMFWQKYFQERNNIFQWNEQVRVSDLSEVCQYLKRNRLLFPCWKIPHKWEVSCSYNDLINMIQCGAVSSLGNGLNEEHRKQLAKTMQTWLENSQAEAPYSKDLHSEWPLVWEMSFLCHKNVMDYEWDLTEKNVPWDLFLFFRKEHENDNRDFPHATHLPFLENIIDFNNDLDLRLSDLLHSVVISAIGDDYLSCEIIMTDPFSDPGYPLWGSVVRARPIMEDIRKKFIATQITSRSIFSFLYGDYFHKEVLEVKVDKQSACCLRKPRLRKKMNTDNSEAFDALIQAHSELKPSSSECIYIYYISTLFKVGSPEFGVGGLIIITENQLSDYILNSLQVVLEDELSFTGISYLYNRQKRNAMITARSAIMARNFSHNVGSHVLANPCFFDSLEMKDTQDPRRLRLQTFHSYAQGRLDFMAQAMSESSITPEPLFFVNDVLNGFFRQGILLDNLLEDNGLPAIEIVFVVLIEKEEAIFNWDLGKHQYISKCSISDVLLGVPGGSIGCHALYAFLENCLRNASKYGKHELIQDNKLIVTLHLEKDKACYLSASGRIIQEEAWVLRISDNISIDEDYDISREIRFHLNTQLVGVEDLDTANPQGHGIQEMKICSQILAGGEYGLHFPSDADCLNQFSDICNQSSCNEYLEYLGMRNSDNKTISTPQSLRCYSRPDSKGNHNQQLIYSLLIPNPVLLGFVTKKDIPSLPACVKRFPDVKNLGSTGTHFGVIMDCDSSRDINEDIEAIAKTHPSLPFRLMIVTNRRDQWNNVLGKYEYKNELGFTFGHNIPQNRLRFIDGDSCSIISRMFSQPQGQKYLGAKDWEAILLYIYDVWLRVYKPELEENETWRLLVGFQHGMAQEIWETPLANFTGRDHNPCISIHIKQEGAEWLVSPNSPYCTECIIQEDVLEADKKNEIDRAFPDKKMIIFDNHGEVFKTIGRTGIPPTKSSRFYHKFGLKDSINLYQMLESPPNSSFTFAWFIYLLVESALTKVVVLDERVGEAALDINRINQYSKAGTFPLFSVTKSNKRFFISQKINELKNTIFDDHPLIENDTSEGLKLDAKGAGAYGYLFIENDEAKVERLNPDILVVHEGVMDMLASNPEKVWDSSGDNTPALYSTVPFVVRTSGRGSETRRLKDWLPFIEFSEISNNTYRGMNKYALSKALMNNTGKFLGLDCSQYKGDSV